MRAAWLVTIALFGCRETPSIATCADSLQGVWRDEQGREWSILDHGPTLEIYPVFADGAPPGTPLDVEVAPRVIDLTRNGYEVKGRLHRRFMRGSKECEPGLPVWIGYCRGNTINLELAEPPVPSNFDPCELPTSPMPAKTGWTRIGPLRLR